VLMILSLCWHVLTLAVIPVNRWLLLLLAALIFLLALLSWTWTTKTAPEETDNADLHLHGEDLHPLPSQMVDGSLDESREEWNSLIANTRNTHLEAKSQKRSDPCHKPMFENSATLNLTCRLPTLLSTPEMRNAATLEWASNIVKKYPYRPKAVRMQEALKERQLRHAAALLQLGMQGLETSNTHLTKILTTDTVPSQATMT